MGAGYPEVLLATEVLVVLALVEDGREIGACKPSAGVRLPFPLLMRVSYLGVTSPLLAPAVVSPMLLTMPRPGIMGAFKELVEVLPLAPKGNLGSYPPERELEEVFGRLVAPEKEPQLLACA